MLIKLKSVSQGTLRTSVLRTSVRGVEVKSESLPWLCCAVLHDVLPRRKGELPEPVGRGLFRRSSLPSTAIEDANIAITRVRTVAAANSNNDTSSSGVDAMYDDA